MARKPTHKEIKNSRLLKEYASWIYCTGCEKTVAYLCYITYDAFCFEYTCNCGNKGRVSIEFEGTPDVQTSTDSLIIIKNRLCCPKDNSPLVTFVDKNLTSYHCNIVCNSCNKKYIQKLGEL